MRVTICGAGIAGLTLAWWLRRSGWDVVLLDEADGPRSHGHMVNLTPPGYDVIARMGLIAQLRSVEHHVVAVTYVSGDGRPRSRLRYPAFDQTRVRHSATVLRRDLDQVLRTALSSLVKIRFGVTVRSVRQTMDGVGVVLSDGTREHADLLVGADGLHSRIRRLVFGPEDEILRPMGYDTAAYLFKDETVDQELDGRFAILNVPGRQAGVYPLGDGALAAFLTHQSTDRHLPRNAAARLREVYGGMGWIIDDVLDRCPAAPFFDQVAQIDLDQWSLGRVTLIGDAGMAVSPLSGHSASLAMASAFALTDALYEEHDIGTALRRYETSMRPAVRRCQAVARRTAKWSVPTHRWGIVTRDALLTAVELPGLSRLLRPLSAYARKNIAPR